VNAAKLHNERLEEKIALLLLQKRGRRLMESLADQALEMAKWAQREWFDRPADASFTKRMKRLRRKLRGRESRRRRRLRDEWRRFLEQS